MSIAATGGKVMGAQGGLIAASSPIIETIVNQGRAFIFNTAPVPAAGGALARSMQLVRGHDDWRQALRDRVVGCQQLAADGWSVRNDPTPIIPPA